MAKRRSQQRSEENLLAGLEQALVTVARPGPLVVGWRWRYELVLIVGIPVGVYLLLDRGGPGAILAGAVVVAGTALPAIRRRLVARIRCIVTAHRIRTGCAQARIHTRQGKLPVILRTSPAPYGERVLVWCRAGTSVEDFESARSLLATACWSTDVRVVTRDPRHAHLVVLSVIRQRRGSADPTGAVPMLKSWNEDTWALPPR